MLRIRQHDVASWVALEKTNEVIFLHGKIKEHLNELQDKKDMKPSSFSVKNDGEVLHFHFLDNCTRVSDMHVIVDSVVCEICLCGNTVIYKHNYHEKIKYYTACNYDRQKSYIENYKATELEPYRGDPRVLAKSEACSFFEIHNFQIFVPENTSSLYFTTGIASNKIHEKADVSFVNSCYTGTISGNIDIESKNYTDRVKFLSISNEKGPCGSGIVIKCIPLGIIHIFASQNGIRKITCKAFLNKDDADFMLEMICTQLLVHKASQLVPHMMIAFGYIGKQVDIDTRGYVQYRLRSVFVDVEFTSIIEEINIHIIFKWNSMFHIYNVIAKTQERHTDICEIKKHVSRYSKIALFLQHIKLCLSVTCRGTCIYRISINSREVIPVSVFDNDDLESLIKYMCAFIHVISCT